MIFVGRGFFYLRTHTQKPLSHLKQAGDIGHRSGFIYIYQTILFQLLLV